MSDDPLDIDACIHALGLLDPEEVGRFRRDLARNTDLQGRVVFFRDAASALAYAAPDCAPPPELKERILASAAGERTPARSVRPLAFPSIIPLLAAACLACALVLAERNASRVRAENAALRAQEEASMVALDAARRSSEASRAQFADASRRIDDLTARLREHDDLAHYKIATLASMLGNSPAALAVAVWDPSREQGVLSVSKLPALASSKDYQLWVIDPQYPNPVNAGTFVVDPVTGDAHVVFRADKPVRTAAKFAVTLERKGGVPKAEGPVVLLGP